MVLEALCLFISAGDLLWIWAWLLVSLGIVIMVINLFLLPAELIEERGRKKENVKGWDRILTSLVLVPWLGVYILSGLDYRFGWSGEMPVALNICGFAFYFIGYMLVTWAMISNRFFSTMVRIQAERGHETVSSGPYRFVRHPGYLGLIITIAAIPPALGSLYGLVMSLAIGVLFVIRTYMEDRTLKAELAGYKEYSEKVRYRLIPFVW